MHATLLLPGVLVPSEIAAPLTDSLQAPALQALLARAHLDPAAASTAASVELPHLGWLARRLAGRSAALPTAPYAHAALHGTPPADEVWHADPVHLELARDHLVVLPPGDAPDPAETAALLAAANALCADAGLAFEAADGRWFARASAPWSLAAPPLAAALGEPLHAVLPTGDDAPRWGRLLNEIQMSWHVHPVNAAREARGLPTINSVWLHGGGRWAALPRPDFTAVHADAPEWRGAAHAAGVPVRPADAPLAPGVLGVWTDALAARQTRDWEGWLAAVQAIDRRLAAAGAGNVDLVLTGARTLRSARARPADRLKFWRALPLPRVLSE